MRLIAVFVIAMVAVVICTLPLEAQPGGGGGYYDGYYDINGYEYHGGYWYRGSYSAGSQAYTRYSWQGAPYYICGRIYPGPWYYGYTAYYPPTAPVVVAPKTTRDRILDMAAALQQHKMDMDLANQLGINPAAVGVLQLNQFAANGITPGIGYQMSGSYQSLIGPVNGNSQYGVAPATFNSVAAAVYGDGKSDTLFQMGNQQILGLQAILGPAMSQFNALIGKDADSRSRAANTIARAMALMTLAGALDSPQVNSGTYQIGPVQQPVQPGLLQSKVNINVNGGVGTPGAPSPTDVTATANSVALQTWGELAARKCASCHTITDSNKQLAGNWDLNSYLQMSREERAQRVYPRFYAKNDAELKRRMPRKKDGSPDDPLTDSEIAAFVACPVVQIPMQSAIDNVKR